jgi:hypothetical protein
MDAPVAAPNVAVAALPLYALLTPVGVGMLMDLLAMVTLTAELLMALSLWLESPLT